MVKDIRFVTQNKCSFGVHCGLLDNLDKYKVCKPLKRFLNSFILMQFYKEAKTLFYQTSNYNLTLDRSLVLTISNVFLVCKYSFEDFRGIRFQENRSCRKNKSFLTSSDTKGMDFLLGLMSGMLSILLQNGLSPGCLKEDRIHQNNLEKYKITDYSISTILHLPMTKSPYNTKPKDIFRLNILYTSNIT